MNRSRKPLKRRRRLYWTYGFLAAAVIAGIAVGILLYRSNRTSPYVPGEKVEGITDKLSLNIPEEAPLPRFSEVSSQAGLDFQQFNGPRSSQLPEDMGSGAAWGDYDNDGDEDLFLVSSGGALTLPPEQRAPCVLYENRGDGTFRRDKDFPEPRIIGMGAAWGDCDGDGWLDLAVTGYNSLILYRNHRGKFSRDTNFPELPGFWAGVAWADFDNDHDLDLYICGYVRYQEAHGQRPKASRQYGKEVPYTLNPSSYEPERNLLFRNHGDGTFREMAAELGVDNPEGRSLSALWHDFNDDGWLELYIANDISDNVLYLNENGKFKDRSHAAWVADYRGAMGLAVGDWNGDGDDDLFVTHWIAQENALYDSFLTEIASRKTPGSPLRFMDVADMAGLGEVALHRVGWGTEFVDLDADGWLDLLVANGSTFETGDVPPRLRPQRPFLFWNRQGKSFHDLTPLNAALAQPHVGRGLAVADYDCDGDMDFVIINHSEGVQLFRNEGMTAPTPKELKEGGPSTEVGLKDKGSGNWVILLLHSRSGRAGALNGSGEGARLIAHVNGRPLRRSVGGASYLSQSSRRVHFGLGTAQQIDSLEVYWSGGGKDIYNNLQANSYWELQEGDPIPRRLALETITHNGSLIRDHEIKQTLFRGVQGGGFLEKSPPGRRRQKSNTMTERERLSAFWQAQRAAVHAMKVENDLDKAIDLFKKALALDPAHEDSLYYLGQCLMIEGNLEEALETFEKLTRINPSSHRGYRQVGFLRARTAKTPGDLSAAETALERALAINPEETGVFLLLGEIDLIRGELEKAEQRLAWVCRSNPRSVAGFYLRGYVAWKSGDRTRARSFLNRAIQTEEQEKKPKGSTSEGEVRLKMHSDVSLLSSFVENPGNKSANLDIVYGKLDEDLKKMPPAAALFEKSGSKTSY
jgi:tetratricopeptide (TPR) repeat protein